MQVSYRWFVSCWLLLALWLPFQIGYAATPLDSVVAVVNDEVITQGQFNQQLAINQQAMLHTPGAPQLNPSQLREQTLKQLIDEKVMTQMAGRYGLKVTQDDVDKAIQNIATANHLTLPQLKQALQSQGMSWPVYRQQIYQQAIDQKIFTNVISQNVNVNPAEVNKVLSSHVLNQSNITAYHVEDMLISLPDNPTAEEVANAKATAMAAMKALQQGKSITAVAGQYSHAMTTTDLGMRAPGDLPAVFVNALQGMQVGDVHSPIQTGNGWHVLKLIEVQGQAPVGAHSIPETHARHILIKAGTAADDGPVKAKLESIRSQALSGGDFAKLAEQYSQDPGSAVKGGDLGWVTPGEMVPPFEAAMNQTAVGQISEPIKTEYGWHIIQVVARRNVDNTDDYKQLLAKNYIFQQKFSQAREDWLKRMRASSYIKIISDNDTASSAK